VKYLKIVLSPIKIKGDLDDPETLQHDVYERIQAMIEGETLTYEIDEDDEEDEGDY
jgi:hypothetical protein